MISNELAFAAPPSSAGPQASPTVTQQSVTSDQGHRPSSLTMESPQPAGPQQRMSHWLAQMLDNVDYAMLLVDVDGKLIHVNAAARSSFDACHPLKLADGMLQARGPRDKASLSHAIDLAARRGLRSLLKLGEATSVYAAVIPLLDPRTFHSGAALVTVGKRAVAEDLSAQWFGRCHGLTLTESHVLQLLCDGLLPIEVASCKGVAESTIRSQICSIRSKTGAQNIRALLHQVAALPPLIRTLPGGDW